MIDMVEHQHQVEAAVAFLRQRIAEPPEVLIQLGTGLGELAKAMEDACTLAYEEIPHFPCSTVASHAGNLVIGRLAGKRTAILQGRFHYYEGYSAREVAFPIRVLALLGAKTAIITNASGGLNPAFQPGTLMVFADHLNLLGDNPLRGPNIDAWGPRFPDLSTPYAPELRQLALDVATRLGLEETTSGTYVCIPGPSLETPAETRMYRVIGADAIGMSTVPEAIAAHHMGIKILGISCLTNKNLPDCMAATSHEEILAQANASAAALGALLSALVPQLGGRHA